MQLCSRKTSSFSPNYHAFYQWRARHGKQPTNRHPFSKQDTCTTQQKTILATSVLHHSHVAISCNFNHRFVDEIARWSNFIQIILLSTTGNFPNCARWHGLNLENGRIFLHPRKWRSQQLHIWIQEISNRTHWTDPKNWISNSSRKLT